MISVVIPTFNRAALLARALESVLGQRYKPVEVVVVDDGSTDETAAIMRARYPQVIYVQQSQRGVSTARNAGIAATSGDWIAFLDSDDTWMPTKLQAQWDALSANADYHVCHTEEIWIRNGRRVNQMQKHEKRGGWIYAHCLPMCCISPSSVMIHRSVFDKVGTFDPELPACEDYDLWLRICARYPVLYLDEPLITKYGGHADQLSRAYWGMDRFRIAALCKALDRDNAQPHLSAADLWATKQMLRQKLDIYLLGAQKRNKHDEIANYQRLYDAYDLNSEAI